MEDVKMAVPILTIPEYAKQTRSTYSKVKASCESGVLPAYKTQGGQWRILVKDSGVPWEIYEKALQRISFLEAKLKSMKAILENV